MQPPNDLAEHARALIKALAQVGRGTRQPVPTQYALLIDSARAIIATPIGALPLEPRIGALPLEPRHEADRHEADRHEAAANWAADIAPLRLELWQELARATTAFLCQYEYDDDGEADDRFCFGELVFRALCRLDVEVIVSGQLDMTVCAQDIAFCRDYALCVESARHLPLIQYSPAQLVDAVDVLRNAFCSCPYSQELQQYVELLEMAAAWHVMFDRPYHQSSFLDVGAALVSDSLLAEHVWHDDDPIAPDHPINPDPADPAAWGAWAAGGDGGNAPVYERTTGTFVHAMWGPLLGMHRTIFEARCFADENVELNSDHSRLSADWLEPVVESLLTLCAANTYVDMSPSMRECFMLMHMRPGDRELFRLVNPSSSSSDVGIVSTSLKDARIKDINVQSLLSPIEGVQNFLKGLQRPLTLESVSRDLYAREPVWFGLCLHDLLDMSTQDAPGNSWAQFYSRRARDVKADAREARFAADQRPILVQLFNHWQLMYRGRVYWFNSALMAYTAWYKLRRANQLRPLSLCRLFACPLTKALLVRRQQDRLSRQDSSGQAAAQDNQALVEWAARFLET